MTSFQTTLEYFHELIDHNGIVQFSDRFQKSIESGYAIEDQARGLIAAVWLGEEQLNEQLLELIKAYREPQRLLMIRNHDGSFNQDITDPSFRDEASAEVLWALGELQAVKPSKDNEEFANHIIAQQTQGIYSRAAAYALIGAAKMNHQEGVTALADRLTQLYKSNAEGYWHWFENFMTYANSLLPWSLLAAYQAVPKQEYLDIGLESLNFLNDHFRLGGIPVPAGTGNHDLRWWIKGETMPIFDQQPIDASYLCLANVKAYEVTQNSDYLKQARFFHSWFTGGNIHGVSMIRSDGACHDGLGNMGVNMNAGAESTVCYILATLALAKHDPGFKTDDIANIEVTVQQGRAVS